METMNLVYYGEDCDHLKGKVESQESAFISVCGITYDMKVVARREMLDTRNTGQMMYVYDLVRAPL